MLDSICLLAPGSSVGRVGATPSCRAPPALPLGRGQTHAKRCCSPLERQCPLVHGGSLHGVARILKSLASCPGFSRLVIVLCLQWILDRCHSCSRQLPEATAGAPTARNAQFLVWVQQLCAVRCAQVLLPDRRHCPWHDTTHGRDVKLVDLPNRAAIFTPCIFSLKHTLTLNATPIAQVECSIIHSNTEQSDQAAAQKSNMLAGWAMQFLRTAATRGP